ncbi:FapA family protein [Marinospirillum sp. MEB164]|uniref:FapA family protein n=1 Tax=Marinospirillum alkalitolerans TaxID=3123374 RepID=A0ABW8PXH2_9GAMM
MGQQPDDTDLMLSIPTPEELGLTFKEDEQGDYWAIHQPTGMVQPFEPEDFPQIMELAGFPAADYPIESAALAVLLDAMRRGEACEQRLGGPVDARAEVHLSPNQMLASVVLHPPQGRGQDITSAALSKALQEAHVVRGLIDESLAELTSAATSQQLRTTGLPVCQIVAYGESAYDGEDAWLEPLIDEIMDRRPQMNDDGQVDFFELGDFPHVDADQALVRRHPPTQGKTGWTVTGKTIKGRNGKDITLSAKDETVRLAPDDHDLLLSSVAGMPVVHEKGALVEQVLKLEEVGLKSGHVRFDGSVFVKGNVNPGMKIEVTGDVKVGGLVEAAYIKAGGSIEIGGGVIGRKAKEERGKPLKDANESTTEAYLHAGVTVKARFIQEAKVKAAQEIIVQKQILHSKIKAGVKIHLLGKGAIVGGLAEANQFIDIGIAGAPANVQTHLRVGGTEDLKQESTKINHRLQQIEVQKSKLKELIAKIKQLRKPITEEKKQQIMQARNQLQAQENSLYDRLAKIQEDIKERQHARIHVRKTCFPGTLLEIDEAQFSPRNDLGKVTFFLRDGEVQMR